MELFKSGFKSVLGAQQQEEQLSYAETVERLVDRINTSTLLEDRRDACRALKSLSRKYRVEVGAQGMNALCQILQTDYADTEIVGYVLDMLCNITSPELFEEEEKPSGQEERYNTIGEQFTEIFIKNQDNVGIVLNFLDEYNFRVRWSAVKLLSNILHNKPKEIQEIVLISPMGVSKLMDLLADSREVIRNDALLLLIQLTKGNANIQKIVAFENAFDRLFDVISEEGYADGGIVVEDCLLLMINLLRNNVSNQNFFKEGSYIQRLYPMFELPDDDNDDIWSAQKVSNIFCVLQVVRALVAPTNPAQVTVSCQKTLFTSGILQSLCNILMAAGVPVNILTESINTTAEIIRGNYSNQEYFVVLKAPCNPPREALVILLMSMVNEKQLIGLRCAVLYCFQCFLFKNEMGQTKLIQTLLPSTIEQDTISTGQLLCAGLFSTDVVSNWFSAVALAHSLIDNPVQKEQMLKVMLTPSSGSPPVSLLAQVTNLLQKSNKVQSKLGLLMLLTVWLSHCPLAVSHFLNLSTSIPYLTTQASTLEHDENVELVQGLCAFLMGICLIFNDGSVTMFTKENVYQLIVKRIGVETFVDKLNEVTRHENYSKSIKHPQMRCKTASELLLDYEFCKLFKILEGMVVKAVTSQPGTEDADRTGGSSLENVDKYKELIREQDKRIYELSSEKNYLKEQLDASVNETEDLRKLVYSLQQQNANLRLQETMRTELSSLTVSTDDGDRRNEDKSEIDTLSKKLKEAENEITELKEKLSELTQLKKDQEDLLELLADMEQKSNIFRARLIELGEQVPEESDDDDDEILNETGVV